MEFSSLLFFVVNRITMLVLKNFEVAFNREGGLISNSYL